MKVFVLNPFDPETRLVVTVDRKILTTGDLVEPTFPEVIHALKAVQNQNFTTTEPKF